MPEELNDRFPCVLVTGGRDCDDRGLVYRVLDQVRAEKGIITLIQGGARGADRLARDWARERGVPCRSYNADWEKYGRGAGPIRNRQMLYDGLPDVVVAFPGGRGTNHMLMIAEAFGGIEIRDHRTPR